MGSQGMQKWNRLKKILRDTGGVVVAFSGGVDSSVLAAAAVEELGNNALLATAVSPSFTKHELVRAKSIAKKLKAKHKIIQSNEFSIPGYVKNNPDRCYVCKKERFQQMFKLAAAHGLPLVVDGTITDDACEFRPGEKAAAELGVRHPLREAGFSKADVRKAARRLNLPHWNRPSQTCLATRVPYGTPLDPDTLKIIEKAEDVLHEHGFETVRVRHFGDTARIEVPPGKIASLARPAVRNAVVDALKKLGYHYVTLDLQGYRSGSMDETFKGGRGKE